MTYEPATSRLPDNRRFSFSFGSIILGIAIVGLAITNVMTYRELSQIKQALQTHGPMSAEPRWPLSAQEVARQFEKSTTLGPVSTTVKEVRYSPEEDAYRVRYSWANETTGEVWSTDVELSPTGYGEYYGEIRSDQFLDPLGYDERFVVSVETPSRLVN